MTCLLDWLTKYEAVAVWLEGIALILILVLDGYEFRRQGREKVQRDRDREEQRKETAAQLKAAEDAANAALLNAKAFIASERPWVVVIPHQSPQGQFSFEVCNKGRTPAKIHSVTFEFAFDSYHDKSRIPPTHTKRVYALRDFLEPNGAFSIYVPHPMETIRKAGLEARVVQGNQFLIFDGRISYWYTSEVDGAVLHETAWSYYFDWNTKDLVRIEEYCRYS